jgi:hypothetical protein
MTIINDDFRVVNKLEASLTDDARVVIYDHHKPQMDSRTTKQADPGSLFKATACRHE